MTQQTFWDLPQVPCNLTEPSKQAARKISQSKDLSGNLARLVVFLQDRGPYGATCPEICAHFGWDGSYARPRIWTLCGNAPAGKPKPPVKIKAKRNPDGTLWVREVHGQKYTIYVVI
jgi:hypothetical protein